MEPTEAECQILITIEQIAAWAGLGDKLDEEELLTSARGSLLALLDVKAEDHLRALGNVSESIYLEALGTWRVHGHNPTIGERSRGEMLGKAARIPAARTSGRM